LNDRFRREEQAAIRYIPPRETAELLSVSTDCTQLDRPPYVG
jgi:hypothetical protein